MRSIRELPHQQYEDIDTGEEVLVDLVADGAVNDILFGHSD